MDEHPLCFPEIGGINIHALKVCGFILVITVSFINYNLLMGFYELGR